MHQEMKLFQLIGFLLIIYSNSINGFKYEGVKLVDQQEDRLLSNVKAYSPYGNFSEFQVLSRAPVINETETPIKHVILVSSQRSGSTFTGGLLRQNWKTWYASEPLDMRNSFLHFSKIRGEANQTEALRIIKAVHSCDYQSLGYFYLQSIYFERQFHLGDNRYLLSQCNRQRELCFDPQFHHEACMRTQYRVSRTTRLPLATVEKLLDQLNGSLDLQIVYLIRDPRAIFNSRKTQYWCLENQCIDYRLLCDDLTSDLASYKRLVQRYGDKIIGLRHEDLSLDTFTRAEKLFNGVGLPYPPGAAQWLRKASNSSVIEKHGNAWVSTILPSKLIPLKWINKGWLNRSEIDDIQIRCSQFMEEFGYKSINFTFNTLFSYDDLMEPKVAPHLNFI